MIKMTGTKGPGHKGTQVSEEATKGRDRPSGGAWAGGLVLALLVAGGTGGAGGCRMTHEGGERPIHIVHDVNIRVDRQLDDFFEFQERYREELEEEPAETEPAPAPPEAGEPAAPPGPAPAPAPSPAPVEPGETAPPASPEVKPSPATPPLPGEEVELPVSV